MYYFSTWCHMACAWLDWSARRASHNTSSVDLSTLNSRIVLFFLLGNFLFIFNFFKIFSSSFFRYYQVLKNRTLKNNSSSRCNKSKDNNDEGDGANNSGNDINIIISPTINYSSIIVPQHTIFSFFSYFVKCSSWWYVQKTQK